MTKKVQKFVERNIALAEALESGRYKQGRNQLKNGDKFCCLGVACDLFREKRKRGKWSEAKFIVPGEEPSFEFPPPEVVAWFGWDSESPPITVGGVEETASLHNDGSFGHSDLYNKRTFKQIAKGFRKLAQNMAKAAA